jgi:anti-sigma factor RsiW
MNTAPSNGEECARELLTQADFDGELDAAQAAEQVLHRETCAQCRATYERLAMVRAALRDDQTLYHPAPESLRAAVTRPQRPAAASGAGRRRWPVAPFGLGAAVAAGIALLIAWHDTTTDLTDMIVDDHVRALQPGHLEDVLSTDRHTVKPWFDGKIDFAPPVKDLADKQFPLEGGRLDYVGGRAVAAMVYQHGHHPINLFVWPAGDALPREPTASSRRGYNVVRWSDQGMVLWVVSDLEAAQLDEFVRLWRAAN